MIAVSVLEHCGLREQGGAGGGRAGALARGAHQERRARLAAVRVRNRQGLLPHLVDPSAQVKTTQHESVADAVPPHFNFKLYSRSKSPFHFDLNVLHLFVYEVPRGSVSSNENNILILFTRMAAEKKKHRLPISIGKPV